MHVVFDLSFDNTAFIEVSLKFLRTFYNPILFQAMRTQECAKIAFINPVEANTLFELFPFSIAFK